jgi:hypothetical protein
LEKKKDEPRSWFFLLTDQKNWAWFWRIGAHAIHIYLAPDINKIHNLSIAIYFQGDRRKQSTENFPGNEIFIFHLKTRDRFAETKK